MLSPLSAGAQRFLTDLSGISDRLAKAQRQLSSGLKLEVASDDPDHVSSLLQSRADLSRVSQIKSNLGLTKSEADGASTALSSAVEFLQNARVLGAQGANDTQTAATRSSLADQVGTVLEDLVRIANTTVGGRFVFSGDSDQQAAYTFSDLSQPYPISDYQGSAATRESLHPTGPPFLVSHTADQIFNSQDPTQNVFAAVNNLRLALQANDTTAIQTALNAFDGASTHLNSELAFYGNTQNRVDTAISTSSTLETQLHTQISNIQDADAVEAITEMTQATVEQQTALAARARIPTKSLFDFLG